MRNARVAADFQDGGPRDAFRTSDETARQDHTLIHEENMGGIGFGHETTQVEHEGVVGAGRVGLDFAKMEGRRLQWWIFGSRQSGGGRRTLLVMSVMPFLS